MTVFDMLFLKEVLRPRRHLATIHRCRHPLWHSVEVRAVQLGWALLWHQFGMLPTAVVIDLVSPGLLGLLAILGSLASSVLLLLVGWAAIRGCCTRPCELVERWR
jgi:hypothetical protein